MPQSCGALSIVRVNRFVLYWARYLHSLNIYGTHLVEPDDVFLNNLK